MTDFLTRLVERSLGTEAAARPQVVPIFAPVQPLVELAAGLGEPVGETAGEDVVRAPSHEARRLDASMPEDAGPRPTWRHRDPPLESLTSTGKGRPPNAPTGASLNRGAPFQAIVAERSASPPAARPQAAISETEMSAVSAQSVREHIGPAAIVPQPIHPADDAPASPGIIRPRPAAEPENDLPRIATSPAQPVVRVTIGRIEVRAVQAPPDAPRARAVASKPSLTLAEYLRQRREGRR